MSRPYFLGKKMNKYAKLFQETIIVLSYFFLNSHTGVDPKPVDLSEAESAFLFELAHRSAQMLMTNYYSRWESGRDCLLS
jgi:hypothetical protein